jgi:hypothetical protein
MDKLPKEMLIAVARFLESKDLCALCLASSEMLDLIRPVLYEFIHWSADRNTSDTARLLISNPDLANSVRKFHLMPGPSGSVHAHRDVMELLQNFTSLSEITLDVLPFGDVGGQQNFVDWVTARKLHLKKLSVAPHCNFYSEDFALPGLTWLHWNQASMYRRRTSPEILLSRRLNQGSCQINNFGVHSLLPGRLCRLSWS